MSRIIKPNGSLVVPTRRAFLGASVGLIAASSIVRAGSIPLLGVGSSGGVAFTTTLDPSNLGSTQALSLGNLTVTGSGGNGIARSISNHSSGKYYCEVTCTTVDNAAIGVCDASMSVNSYLGAVGDSTGVFNGGSAYLGAGSWISGTTTVDGPVASHVFAIALDVGNLSLWIKDLTAGGNWNANASANPATNTDGAILNGGLASGVLYAAATCANPGDSVTFNFGGSAYGGTVPSGFGNW